MAKSKDKKKAVHQAPAGTPVAPGPVNNPADHPATSVPGATQQYDGQELPPQLMRQLGM